MTLDEYLSLNGETAQKFARRVKRATSTITRLRNRETKPDWPTVTAILKATGGRVTPNDFLDEKVRP